MKITTIILYSIVLYSFISSNNFNYYKQKNDKHLIVENTNDIKKENLSPSSNTNPVEYNPSINIDMINEAISGKSVEGMIGVAHQAWELLEKNYAEVEKYFEEYQKEWNNEMKLNREDLKNDFEERLKMQKKFLETSTNVKDTSKISPQTLQLLLSLYNEEKRPSNALKIENAMWLGLGYNIAFGNPLISPQSGTMIDPGFASRIFDINDREKPTNTFDNWYVLPDGFEVQPLQTFHTFLSSEVIKTSREFKEKLQDKLGLESKDFTGGFAANYEYNQIKNRIENSGKIFLMNNSECSIYRVTIDRYNFPKLTKNFIEGIRTLDKYDNKNESSLDAYYNFFKNFGTHYMDSLLMGSKFTYLQETDSNTYTNYLTSVESKSATIDKQIWKIGYSAKYSDEEKKKQAKLFEKSISNRFITTVGAPLPPDLKLETWLMATKKLPMPIDYKIKPLYDIFTDQKVIDQLNQEGIKNSDILIEGIKAATKNYCKILNYKKINCYTVDSKMSIRTVSPTNYFPDSHQLWIYAKIFNIECLENEAINGFKLIQNTNNEVAFEYKCAQSEMIKNQCIYKDTTETTCGDTIKFGNCEFRYLSTHNIKCDDGYVLSSIKWLIKDNEKVKYNIKYKCCIAEIKSKLDNILSDEGKNNYPKEYSPNISFLENMGVNYKDNPKLENITDLNWDKIGVLTSFTLLDVELNNNKFQYKYSLAQITENISYKRKNKKHK